MLGDEEGLGYLQKLNSKKVILKKSIKYILIAAINLIVLTALLALWTDKLELLFNDLVRPIEFLKILSFTVLSLLGMRLLVYYFRKKNIQNLSTKMKMAALLTFLTSSYLYIDYSVKLINNKVVNRHFREQITAKIKPVNGLAHGSTAENLTIEEYHEIANMNWFPKIPLEATQIMYNYQYDGFLPDYSFILVYYLPIEMKVERINHTNGDFSKNQSYEIVGNRKRVVYEEVEH
ncbi:MAG TPA: hypothetical protein PK637_10550 [Flavobacteriales bacterium]|uniref:hypothetical protein n=1 Tax=uncultured Flavobacterium sp. TaxID=165435 RepID=UPI000E7D907A|nr:hypothetical protein [uncultured Flavobacterium sp.]HBI00300.1 hypothetical protein [Flavobacterium sp.]HRE75556.1 hypothetical protein [Flavobacteriales bacterium]HRE97197.1 hypothetical protein [Flavobacteriales bacterium]HRJ38691.1 hypothetical protein [Flavobacteriales bacterium]